MQPLIVPTTWRDRVEDAVAGARENRLLLCVGAAAVSISLALWWRGPSAKVAPPARSTTAIGLSTPAPRTLIVHVSGAVRWPGLYEFPSGARIADAIETAGGALRGADLDAMNLAALLVDGVQVQIPRRGLQGPVASTAPGPGQQLVSLNSADGAQLETIPGIGPVTAAAILEHRAAVGSFASVDELLDVDGIGPATLEAIRPYVTL